MSPSVAEDRPAAEPSEALDAPSESRGPSLLWFLVLGCLFGIILVKAEVVSWFRIQEMFWFQSFRMYGIIGSAVATAALTTWLLRLAGVRTVTGDAIFVAPKQLGKGYRYWIGGAVFGVGWALTGACPGPMFALITSGITVYVVAVLSAIAGTWVYGYLRPHLPHY